MFECLYTKDQAIMILKAVGAMEILPRKKTDENIVFSRNCTKISISVSPYKSTYGQRLYLLSW